MRLGFGIVRIVTALGIVAAIVAQLARSIENAAERGADVAFILVNFFSFFTIESNVLTAVVCAWGAVLLLRSAKTPSPRSFEIIRVCAVSFMATTGIVYNLLLRGIELPQGTTVAWSNEILHVWAPLLIVIDWLFAPGGRALGWKKLWAIVAFPLAWGVYTLVRGALVVDPLTGKNWYPYPFMDPANSPSGYASVAFYVVLIAVVITSVGVGAIAYGRWLNKKRGHPLDASLND